MKICRFSTDPNVAPTVAPGTPGVYWGLLEGNQVRALEGPPFEEQRPSGAVYALDRVRLLPPCWPSKIVCLGRNYAEHARELDHEVPAEPLIFLKPPSSVITGGDTIIYPEDSQRLDHEGEIGVVIGRRCRHLRAGRPAAPYIFGFTCVNDITARDLQKKDGQWTRGKGFDTFCSFGPVISTGLDPAKLEVRTYLNGELRQRGTVSEMLFGFDAILAYISRVMTLEPGDLIATGTPAGVGPMGVGDTVEVVIEGVGALRNRVAGAGKTA